MGAVDEMSFYRGSPIGGSLSYRLYQCGDGQWLFLGALFSHFYAALDALDLLGGGDLSDIGAAVQERLMSGPRDHWLARFRAHQVPAGAVNRREDWLKSEIIRATVGRGPRPPESRRRRDAGRAASFERTPGAVKSLPALATDDQIAPSPPCSRRALA